MLESSCNAVLLVKSWLGQEDVYLWELEAESDLEGTGPVSGEIYYEADMVSAVRMYFGGLYGSKVVIHSNSAGRRRSDLSLYKN
jgi:hypothetical protein